MKTRSFLEYFFPLFSLLLLEFDPLSRLLLPLRAAQQTTRAPLHSHDDVRCDKLFKIVRAHARVHGRNNLEIFLFPRVSLVSDARTFTSDECFSLPEVYLRRKEMVETCETPTSASGARAEPNFERLTRRPSREGKFRTISIRDEKEREI